MWITILLAVLTPAPTREQAETLSRAVQAWSNPSYLERERATRSVLKIGTPAKTTLINLSNDPDAEVANRAHRALIEIVTQELNDLSPMPCADAIWYDPEKRTYCGFPDPVALYYLDVMGRDNRPYLNYRDAMRLYVRDKLIGGANPKLVRLWLTELHRRDGMFLGNDPTTVDWRAYRDHK